MLWHALVIVAAVSCTPVEGQQHDGGGFQPQQLTADQIAFFLQQAQKQHQFSPQQPQATFQQQEYLEVSHHQQQQQQFLQQQLFGFDDPTGSTGTSQGISKIDEIANNQTLAALSNENIQAIVTDEQSVNLLTSCFTSLETCESEATANLINDILSVEDDSAICQGCPAQDTERLKEVMALMVEGISTNFPIQWFQILPKVVHLVAHL